MRSLRRWPRRRASHHPSECVPTSLRHGPLRHSLAGPSKEGGPLLAVGRSALSAGNTGVSCSPAPRAGALPCRPERGWGRGTPTRTASQGSLPGRPKRASFPAPSLGMGPGAPWPGPEECPVCPRGLGWDGPSRVPGGESAASGTGIAPVAWIPLFLGLCYRPEGKTDTQHSPTRPVNLSVVLPTHRQPCS